MVILSGNGIIYIEHMETNKMVVQRSKLSRQSISYLPSFSNLQASGFCTTVSQRPEDRRMKEDIKSIFHSFKRLYNHLISFRSFQVYSAI